MNDYIPIETIANSYFLLSPKGEYIPVPEQLIKNALAADAVVRVEQSNLPHLYKVK